MDKRNLVINITTGCISAALIVVETTHRKKVCKCIANAEEALLNDSKAAEDKKLTKEEKAYYEKGVRDLRNTKAWDEFWAAIGTIGLGKSLIGISKSIF